MHVTLSYEDAQPEPEWIRQFEEKGQVSLQDKSDQEDKKQDNKRY